MTYRFSHYDANGSDGTDMTKMTAVYVLEKDPERVEIPANITEEKIAEEIRKAVERAKQIR